MLGRRPVVCRVDLELDGTPMQPTTIAARFVIALAVMVLVVAGYRALELAQRTEALARAVPAAEPIATPATEQATRMLWSELHNGNQYAETVEQEQPLPTLTEILKRLPTGEA